MSDNHRLLTVEHLQRQASVIMLYEMLGVLLRLLKKHSATEVGDMIVEAGERLKAER